MEFFDLEERLFNEHCPKPPNVVPLAQRWIRAFRNRDELRRSVLGVEQAEKETRGLIAGLDKAIEFIDWDDTWLALEAADHEWIWSAKMIDGDGDLIAGGITRKDLRYLYLVELRARLKKLLLSDLPPAQTAAAVKRPVVDPRDGDGWETVVRTQGISIPRGVEFYLSTHWDLCNIEFKKGRCKNCGKNQLRTSLHHETHDHYGIETAADLMELCNRCHAKIEGLGLWKYKKAA